MCSGHVLHHLLSCPQQILLETFFHTYSQHCAYQTACSGFVAFNGFSNGTASLTQAVREYHYVTIACPHVFLTSDTFSTRVATLK